MEDIAGGEEGGGTTVELPFSDHGAIIAVFCPGVFFRGPIGPNSFLGSEELAPSCGEQGAFKELSLRPAGKDNCFLASEGLQVALSEVLHFGALSLLGMVNRTGGPSDLEIEVMPDVPCVPAFVPMRATVEYVVSPLETTSLNDVSHKRIGGGGGGSCEYFKNRGV